MFITNETPTTGALLAELFAYPHEGYAVAVEAARRCLSRVDADAEKHLAEFAAAIERLTTTEREELFTRTFDINPIGALEIGWHLFGEDYHRGALLARLRVELRRHNIAETTELPDHLTHVLLLLDRMCEDEARDFALACVLPALEKMLAGFGGKENPYEHLLRCVLAVLRRRFNVVGDLGDNSARPPRSEADDPVGQELLPILTGSPSPPLASVSTGETGCSSHSREGFRQ